VRHSDSRGKMEDAVVAFDEMVHQLFIQDRVLDDAHRRGIRVLSQVAEAPGREVVEDGHRVAARNQPVDDMAPDESSATSHQRLHRWHHSSRDG
jgi:methylmalonyl-CoA mutase cobalamin-binding subunit